MGNSEADELELIVGIVQPEKAAAQLTQLGYDFRYWKMVRRDHLTFPLKTVQCEMENLIAHARVRDPARVVYSVEPFITARTKAGTGLALHHDRAYWMSGLVPDGTFARGDKATVDVTSLARADRAPSVTPVVDAQQNLTGGRDVCGPNPAVTTTDGWTLIGQKWSAGAAQPISNALAATLAKVASATLDLPRM